MIKYLLPILNRFYILYKDLRIAVPQFPRRESNPLESLDAGFTVPPAFLNGLLRIKVEGLGIEPSWLDFQSNAEQPCLLTLHMFK